MDIEPLVSDTDIVRRVQAGDAALFEIPGATNAELKALLVGVRPALAHLEHAKHIQSTLGR